MAGVNWSNVVLNTEKMSAKQISKTRMAAINYMGKNIGTQMKNNFMAPGLGNSIWHNAVQGAIVGGAIGGTTNAMNGGSFWDGAKSGAMHGATGWAGYKMAMRATGATKINPFNKNGILGSTKGMYNSQVDNMSDSVKAILRNKQTAGAAAQNNFK